MRDNKRGEKGIKRDKKQNALDGGVEEYTVVGNNGREAWRTFTTPYHRKGGIPREEVVPRECPLPYRTPLSLSASRGHHHRRGPSTYVVRMFINFR
ncbi:hypothetical protein MRX96_041024 [Rhipicephalus microplus]